MNYQAGSANLLNPSTVAQANEQYGNVNQGLSNQAAFLQAIQGQNGLGNQSNVFNQLQGVANGTGPNPAQAMLANASGQNVANTAALMAGQRGASANPALIARQAGNAGAMAGQNLAGQGAALQAQQSLNALNQMGGLATNQANQQANATNAYSNAAQNAQGNVLNGIAGQNQAAVGNQGSQNSANAGVAGGVAKSQGDLIGNITSGIGSVFGMAEGGEVTTPLVASQGATSGPQSSFGKFMQGYQENQPSQQSSPISGAGQEIGKGIGSIAKSGFSQLISSGLAHGGQVPAMVSPGEKYLAPDKVNKVAQGADPLKEGKTIPGKPKVGGAKDSYSNDNVPATLQEGGIVLPRSVTQAKNAPEAARKFVAAILKQKAMA